MLESLDRTNIGNLNLDEPPLAWLPFDAEKEITEDEWQTGLAIIEHEKPRVTFRVIEMCDIACIMKTIFPYRTDEFRFDNEVYSQVKSDFDHDKNSMVTGGVAKEFYARRGPIQIRTVFPDQKEDLFNEGDKNNMTEILKGLDPEDKDNWFYIPKIALNLITFFPETATELNLEDYYERYSTILKNKLSKYYPELYDLENMVDFKLLFPEKQGELYLGLDDWRSLKGELADYRRTPKLMHRILEMLAFMKMMAAEEVKIVDQEIELIMPTPNLNISIPALPEMRKF
ncbi:MAG: hypothetical protein Q7R49_01750 [Candidatus Daviesbacteria bacterium]|nr:hypothetical protein [Candidatus Daviesbacteria bacterium]